MRTLPGKLVPLLFGLLPAGAAGCGLADIAVHVTASSFTEPFRDCRERRRNRLLAEDAWESVAAMAPGTAYSADYERGFKDGFADYLYRGGDGQPPPLPPDDYRKRYGEPGGAEAVMDWFAGYRVGAGIARASGYREAITLPVSLPPPPPPGPLPGRQE